MRGAAGTLVSLYALSALLVGPAALRAQEVAAEDGAVGLHVDASLAKRGKALWHKRHCADCHTFGAGPMIGPDLRGVLLRRSAVWLRRWLKDTDRMLQSDSVAISLLVAYGGVRMPNHSLSDDEVEALLHFVARASAIAEP